MAMKHTKFLFMAALVATSFAYSCNSTKKEAEQVQTPTQAQIPDAHTAENSLSWPGTYSGTLPCADCEGISTELTLNKDLTYVLTTAYMGKKATSPETLKGKFTWKGNNVNLEGIAAGSRPSMFQIQENRVQQLDMEGKEITGDLAQHYVLKKNGNEAVEDKKWQLVEVNGKAVKGKPETHYVIFHSKDGRMEAKANCNNMSREYKITNELQVKIGQGISTMMACPDGLEDEFSAVLSKADNFSTDGKTLSLNKAKMAPLARFSLVENK